MGYSASQEGDKNLNSPVTTEGMWKKKMELKDVLAIIGLYGTALSALNLLGYWGTFQINIFEYLSFTEVVGAAFPYAAYCIASLIGAAFIVSLLVSEVKTPKEITKREALWFFVANTLSGVMAFLLRPGYLTGALALVLVSISLLVWRNKYVRVRFRDKSYIPMATYVAAAMLIMSFALGREEGHKVINGDYYLSAHTAIFKKTKLFGDDKQLKYVGKAGDKWFFLTMNNRTFVVADKEDIEVFRRDFEPSGRLATKKTLMLSILTGFR